MDYPCWTTGVSLFPNVQGTCSYLEANAIIVMPGPGCGLNNTPINTGTDRLIKIIPKGGSVLVLGCKRASHKTNEVCPVILRCGCGLEKCLRMTMEIPHSVVAKRCCHWCGAGSIYSNDGVKTGRCGRCNTARYCNNGKCQKLDWDAFHSTICSKYLPLSLLESVELKRAMSSAKEATSKAPGVPSYRELMEECIRIICEFRNITPFNMTAEDMVLNTLPAEGARKIQALFMDK